MHKNAFSGSFWHELSHILRKNSFFGLFYADVTNLGQKMDFNMDFHINGYLGPLCVELLQF